MTWPSRTCSNPMSPKRQQPALEPALDPRRQPASDSTLTPRRHPTPVPSRDRKGAVLRSLAILALIAAQLSAATVSGTVELRDSREPAVRKGRDYSGVVISLVPVNGLVRTANPTRHAVMVQKNKTFTPHVLAVMVGTTVDFPNYDPIFH